MRSHIQKLISLTVVVAFVAVPAQSYAQSTSTEPTIEDLQERVNELLEQVSQLQEQLTQTQQQVEELRFDRTLRRGMNNEQVEALQEFLASHPDIYPEGLVTGYFGPLTEQAVKRLQKKHGISQVGVVGPQTRSQLNKLLTEGAGKSGNVPPGLLRAPGIAKKLDLDTGTTTDDMDDEEEDEDDEEENEVEGEVESVATSSITVGGEVYTVNDDTEFSDGLSGLDDLEEGDNVKIEYETEDDERTATEIEQEEEDDDENEEEDDEEDNEGDDDENEEGSDDTDDVELNNVSSLIFGTDTAVVTWNTNTETSATLYYSTTTPAAGDANTHTEHNAAMSTHHGFLLDDLEAGTEYNYFGVSTDDAGRSATSSTYSFTTDS